MVGPLHAGLSPISRQIRFVFATTRGACRLPIEPGRRRGRADRPR